MNATPDKPAIERRMPLINKPADALEDTVCALERVRSVFAAASSDLIEHVVNSSQPELAVKRAYDVWAVLYTAEVALEQLYDDLFAIADVARLTLAETAS